MIDFNEYKDFISKLDLQDDDGPNEEQVKEIFDEIDTDKSGQLDIQEFGKAIFECLKKPEQNVD